MRSCLWFQRGASILAFALFAVQTVSGAIIPADRLYQWEGNVGVPGGIPNVTTVHTTIASPTTASIRSALGSCPSNQVVVLGPGTFVLSGCVDWQGVGNGVVLRGTKINGTNATKLITTSFPGAFNFRAMFTTTSSSANISANTVKGGNTIEIAAGVPTWVTVGGIYGIDELNDPALVSTSTCREGADMFRNKWGANGSRGLAQLFRVVAKTATTITTEAPLYYGFRVSQGAQIWTPYNNGGYRMRCGIEDLDIEGGAGDSDSNIINMENCYGCWVKGVNSTRVPAKVHIITTLCYRCEFRDNTFYDSFRWSAGQGYGVALYYASCNNLIENNIFRKLHVSMQANYGSGGNVFGYNFQIDNESDPGEEPAINVHGCHAYMNLFEGNVCYQKAMFDCIHGSSSHNILFRNRIFGYQPGLNLENQCAVDIDYYNRKCSVVGNILGTDSFHTQREARAGVNAGFGSLAKIILKFGYINAWGGDDGCFDTYAVLDPIVHGNYDTVTDSVVWDPNIADHTIPASLYRSSKPAWFGNRPWPPVDPANPGTAVPTNIPAGFRYVYGVAPASGPINLAPIPVVIALPKLGAAPLTVNFSSVGSIDPEGATLTYNWTFGDGGTSTSANPSRTYQNPGSYTAYLTISDGTNTVSSTNLVIIATVPGQNLAPTAQASANVTGGTAPLSVSFSSAGSSDPEGATLTYNWQFGDTTSATTVNPTHVYSSSGTFTAQLRVSDGTNTSAPANITIVVGNAASGLVASYGFEEGSGNSVIDTSGNNNGGTLNGATRTPGKFGSGLNFNGTSAMVTIPDSASLDATAAITLEAWVYPTSTAAAWRDVIFKDTDVYFLMGTTPTSQAPAFGGAFASANAYGAAALPLNTWSHLAGTYDGATMRLYINGVQIASRAQTGAITTSANSLYLGGDATSGQYWSGRIDEVRIYNRALDATEIQNDMNNPVVGTGSAPASPQGLRIILTP